MCDTDDTDDLLLIPPDFFVIDSDSGHSNTVEPYYNIVDGLIKQVSNLQNRIESIESISLSNSLDLGADHPDNMQNLKSNPGFGKYNSIDDLYHNPSTQTTPQKPYGKFKINSLPASPVIDRDRFSPGRNARINRDFKPPLKGNLSPQSARRLPQNVSPEKEDGHTLDEIDTFLSKVKVIQRMNAARNLENEFNGGDIPRKEKNNTEVNKLLADFDRQLQKIESEAPDVHSKRESELSKNREPAITKEKTWREGDNKESVPDYGAGAREILYPAYNEPSKLASNFKKNAQAILDQSFNTNDSWISLDKYSDTSSESTQLTAFNSYKKGGRGDLLNSPLHSNALNVINMHKQLQEGAKKVNVRSRTRERKPSKASNVGDNLGLLSLAEIWNKNSTHVLQTNPTQLAQKLQEEKLRRQHCEELIQELQNRNLELQQKLSVALKVDDSKNNTIRHFQDAFEKTIARLEILNNEKQMWNQEMTRLKSRHSSEIEEITKKVAYYENEAAKALSLAHGNQEKLGSLETRSSDLQGELQSIEYKCRELQDNYSREVERNKELSDMLNRKEAELNENKNILSDASAEMAQTKRAVEACQAEFFSMKAEYAKLQTELKEEEAQIKQLSEQKKVLLKEVEAHRHREEEIEEELNKVKKQLESSKIELKNYYQGQVEILVQNKLTEFQSQLDRAESTYKEETKKREMSIAKTAANHIQQISDKYSLEIKLLEKKHQEEIKLYELQILQYKQQIDSLQTKLDHFQEKRVHIAKQLQKIMEAQWVEALRIITSGKSPTLDEQTYDAIDQLNSLKAKSYNNVEEVLSQPEHNLVKRKNEAQIPVPNEESVSSNSNNYEKNPHEAYTSSQMDTPISSRASRQYNENEIQKYINLLLSRPSAGNQTQEGRQMDGGGKTSPDNLAERAHWHHVRSRRHK